MTNNLNYEKVNAVKIIVPDQERRILLIQEPQMNEWMPGRWGLPGGRPLEKQSLRDAASHKLIGDIGRDIPLSGLYKIEELLIDGRTVLMFILVAQEQINFDPEGIATAHQWASLEEIQKLDVSEFTEYYNKELFLEFMTDPTPIVPIDIIETHTYHLFSGNSEYKKWWEARK